jgi:hypothetical protein
MITKFLYTSVLFGFVYIFASTTQLPRLLLSNFTAPPAEANQPQQKIKRVASSEASPQKVNIMPPVSVSTPKAPPSAAQFVIMFLISLLNFFICYRLIRWIYRVFLRTPIHLIRTAFSFLVIKPYRYLFTPRTIATYNFMHPVRESREPRTIVVQN